MVTKELATVREAPEIPDRIYAIGDVHGHADRLRSLHAMIRDDLADHPVQRALLIHLGDYIDRGPDSADCIEQLAHGSPIRGLACCNLMGNHEKMLLNALEQPEEALLWLRNGGDATLRSWGIDPFSDPRRWTETIPASHLAFLQSLVPMVQSGTYLFVHAGVRPGIRLPMQSLDDILWIRNGFLDWEGKMLPDAPKLRVVHGHTPSNEPELRPNRLGIDTNAARGGKLTCAALSSDSVYFLQA